MKKTICLLCICSVISISLPAQWIKTNGLSGGDVGGFLLLGDTVMLEMGHDIYYSADHGQTWLSLPPLDRISFDKAHTNGDQILAYRYAPELHSRLVLSDHLGQPWHTIISPDNLYFYESFLAYGYVYGSDYHGLYRSNDEGATWEYVTSNYLQKIQFDGQHITAVNNAYIVQSTDGGFAWDTLMPLNNSVKDMLQHENQIFIFTDNFPYKCFSSNDYGQTWQDHTAVDFHQVHQFFWHNGTICGLDFGQLLQSSDLGKTWGSTPLPDAYYPAYQGVSVGNSLIISGLYSFEAERMLRSTDNGTTWFPSDFGTLSGSGKLRTIGNNLYAANSGSIYRLNLDGLNWTKLNLLFTQSPLAYGAISDYVETGNKSLLSKAGYPYISYDGGANWYPSGVQSPFEGDGITKLETLGDKVLGSSFNAEFHDFYISNNNGSTFSEINSLYDQYQTLIAAVDVDQGKVFAVSSDNKLYRSDDGCVNWTFLTDIMPANLGGSKIQLMVRGNVIALVPEPIYKKMLFSNNGGQTWTLVDLTTAGLPFGEAIFSELLKIGNYLVAATKNGIFISHNDGIDWIDWNDGLTQRNITNLEIHDGYLWAGTQSSGIWKRSLAELGMKPVAGKVYFDKNFNTQQDPGEPTLGNVLMQSLSTNAYTNSRPDGTYDLFSNLGQEQIKAHLLKPYWLATPAIQTAPVPSAGVDFAMSLNPEAKDLTVDLTNVSVLRPGFETNYMLNWRNAVPIAATGVSLTLNYPADLLDLLESIPTPSTQSGGTLSWNLGNIAADATGSILLRFKVPITDSLGTAVCATATINPLFGDLAPNDNTYEHCATVFGSFDPNDKQAEPSEVLTLAQLANNEPIIYTIRFQNTGNFPASFVRITDTLQQNFDPASFQLLSSSHPCSWSLRGQGELEFMFDNIQLSPVTTDEPGSHGFVKYSVRPLQNLPHGTPLRNTAHIFFDFNAPVTTNTTETLAGLVKTNEAYDPSLLLKISPNPSSQIVRIETGTAPGELQIQDAMGRIVLQQCVDVPNIEISVEALPQGMYQVIFTSEKSTQFGSLVVQR